MCRITPGGRPLDESPFLEISLTMKKFVLSLLLGTVAVTAAPADEGGEIYDLDRSIRRTMEANRSLQIRRTEDKKSGYAVREAWAGALPQINMFGTLNRNFEVQSTFIQASGDFGGGGEGDSTGTDGTSASGSEVIKLKFGADYDYMLNFQLRQPIWLGGKVGAALRAARAYNRSSESRTDAAVAELVLQTRRLFYTALLAREVIDVFESAHARAERHMEMVRLQYEQGLVSEFEVLRAEVEVVNQDAPLIAARNSYSQAISSLKVALALSQDEPIQIRGEFDYLPVPGERLVARAESALRERDDREAMVHQVELMKQALRAAKGDRYPNFYLLGAYSMSGASDDLDFQEDEQASASSASIEVSLPLWTSGATTARINQAKADFALARLQLELIDEEIKREVNAVRLDLESADKQVEANQKTVELARRAFEIAEVRYESGLLSQVELLDVNDTLTEARVNLLRSLFEALIAQASWERTVGIEWGESW